MYVTTVILKWAMATLATKQQITYCSFITTKVSRWHVKGKRSMLLGGVLVAFNIINHGVFLGGLVEFGA